MKIGVFVVDDHYMVIEGIKSLLQNESSVEWMGHATHAESCLSFLVRHQPDVILMDVNLPDKSGIDLCKEVKQLYPGIAILGLSTFNQHTIIKNMIENGAAGYVLKNASKEELMDAIQTIVKGKHFYSTEVVDALRQPEAPKLLITRREKEVLLLIAEGLTNSDISEKLFISIPTVNTHRKSLLEKLEVKNTAMLIGKAGKLGLI